MQDLSTFFKRLRDISREKRAKDKERILEELIKNKHSKCLVCRKKGDGLCETCMEEVHRDVLDLKTSSFCDLFKRYKDIRKARRIKVFEFLFEQMGSICCEENDLEGNKSTNTCISRSLTNYTSQLNAIASHSFDSKDERLMLANLKIKINREIVRNYFLAGLFRRAEIVEEHLRRIRIMKYDTSEIEIEILKVYQAIYGEI